ncbi:MAG: M23 family metallopeptidase [Deltaproteobacteria bacterium]|nr:M23 family metallopeptidase [Deltaproteobacteria bacterium]
MGKLTGATTLSKVFSCCPPCRKFIGFLLAGLMILSCSGYPVRGDRPHGVYHRVKSGETLSMIARAYHVDLQELAEINNISNPDQIEGDGVIFIPDANQILDDVMTAARPQSSPSEPGAVQEPAKTPKVVLKVETPKKEAAVEPKMRQERPPADVIVKDHAALSRVAERDTVSRRTTGKPETEKTADQPVMPKENGGRTPQIQFDKKRFAWPVKGKIVSHFGIQPNRMYYNGIRIAAGEGTTVQTAADGLVIFSAPLKDYGETIIIQHEDQYATVYSNLGIRAVRGDARVKKGDRIAFLGKGEDQKEPYLHFEIRYKNKARNPLFFLP